MLRFLVLFAMLLITVSAHAAEPLDWTCFDRPAAGPAPTLDWSCFDRQPANETAKGAAAVAKLDWTCFERESKHAKPVKQPEKKPPSAPAGQYQLMRIGGCAGRNCDYRWVWFPSAAK